uniref:Uncharacterized protein n=1 Tax=Anguilla anguilla TaxID=7936 RepID=A0A0E9QW29_ANGAN
MFIHSLSCTFTILLVNGVWYHFQLKHLGYMTYMYRVYFEFSMT